MNPRDLPSAGRALLVLLATCSLAIGSDPVAAQASFGGGAAGTPAVRPPPPPPPSARVTAPLPAGQALPLENPGFLPDASGASFPGWVALEHMRGNSYTFVADRAQFRSAPASVRIRRHGEEFFGMMEQRVLVKPEWKGRSVRLSGWLRTEGATGKGAALVLGVRDGSDNILSNEMMDGRRVRGDQPWQRYAIEVKVPPTAWWLRTGVMLEDDGTLWADDLVLELID